MARAYAAETEVPVHKSKGAIEALLVEHGAKKFAIGWSETHDNLQFELFTQTIRFTLPRPDRNAKKFTRDRRGFLRSSSAAQKAYEQADRQRWRALYLVIRAKLEAIQSGIAIYEQEFLAFIVGPDGMTVGDILIPRLENGRGVQGLLGPAPAPTGDLPPGYRRCSCGEMNSVDRTECGYCGAELSASAV